MADVIGHLEVEQLLSKLTELKGELGEEVDALNGASQPVTLDQQSVGRVSRGDALQQQNMALANLQQCQERIRQIDDALKKIDSDDYGFCESCGEPISFERLQVRPESTLCIRCQTIQEQQ